MQTLLREAEEDGEGNSSGGCSSSGCFCVQRESGIQSDTDVGVCDHLLHPLVENSHDCSAQTQLFRTSWMFVSYEPPLLLVEASTSTSATVETIHAFFTLTL